MHFKAMTLPVALVLALSLASCGGGGGGGSSSTPSNQVTPVPGQDPNAALSFSPSTLSVDLPFSGDSTTLSTVATLKTAITGALYILVTEPNGIIEPNIPALKNADGTYRATVTTRASLKPGNHTGTIKIQLCKDDKCASEYPGSPAYLPISVNIAGKQEPLVPWNGVADWTTTQGNNAHNGYVPVTLDPKQFSPRWRLNKSYQYDYRVYDKIITSGNSAVLYQDKTLTSINIDDGSLRWTALPNSGSYSFFGLPAIADNKLYLTSRNTSVLVYNLVDSQRLIETKQANYAYGTPQYAPVIDDNLIYSVADYLNGVPDYTSYLYGYNKNGGIQWKTPINKYFYGTPAVDRANVYVYAGLDTGGSALSVLSKKYGAVLRKFPDTAGTITGSFPAPGIPVLGSMNDVIVINSRDFQNNPQNALVSFDIDNGVNWVRRGQFVQDPVVGGGVIYVASVGPHQITAYDEKTGNTLWSWQPPKDDTTAVFGNLIVTNNMLFLSTEKRIYGLDLASRSTAWTYDAAGYLTIAANGTLLVAGTAANAGTLLAFNLK
ncbi:Outer membrane protein assembly factor BamB, contains PQQ-like beta-propeller repeat [Andreprevotia lacus DSM 23236]|uniref:Outer membrane protein assembly factor BamB, contains PQQ-like beta-propeller repeat n=1 Tax=Andreprevotia lacus DSM 23236 TaxID=1121001 RepID=A0A1W1XZK1_9NEIS|nr:PQQ-binding-like beta-propeller repeat protein [Andreprevotia lacus]SMC29305.1 Outer membrane protein assembly factor BamB, contains PQQ-like beta-propeller repeat [Andreprevotia lacus DSM 23236]